ncbi:hypothetical protein NB640_11370 [Oxalobacter vibrioformis]|uniref:Uncharacterized protein n=1 Tax=Oxalobacter vibrioformis TaxID=933080 RepID=A0A9E9LYB5_9BURK|nr:hypothetical protein [Oxalobacter vibrioformis]WAW09805.1 hypothetical protein NB640_11370 [Oxalobacter vibrioformis]
MDEQDIRQRKRDEERDEIEVQNMLVTAYDEIKNFSGAYGDWSDSDFRDVEALYAKRIVVFGTDFYSLPDIARNIGKIKDQEVRLTTMKCFRCIQNFKTNHENYNEIVFVFNNARSSYKKRTAENRFRLQDIEERMKFHASLLVSLYKTMCTEVDAFLEVIQRKGIIENK